MPGRSRYRIASGTTNENMPRKHVEVGITSFSESWGAESGISIGSRRSIKSVCTQ